MKNSCLIGIDIGGTNTDAVLVDKDGQILSAVKTTTTEEISFGFSAALKALLEQSAIPPAQIEGVFLGTTHATNAILQKKELLNAC